MSRETRLKAFLRRWTRFAVRHAVPVMAAFVLATTVLAFYTSRNLGVSTDTADMITPDLEWRQDYIRYRDEFPLRTNTIIVVVEAGTAAAAELACGFLDARLDAMPEFFEDSYAPTIDPPIAGRELLYLEPSRLHDLVDSLAAVQPFLGNLRENYDLRSLLDLLALAAEQGLVADNPAFFDAMTAVIADGIDGGRPEFDWSVVGGESATRNAARRLIVVNPVLDKGQARPARAAIEALRLAGQETVQNFDTPVSVKLTGVVAIADDEYLSVTRNAGRVGLLALLSVVVLLVLAFRSSRLLVAGVATLLTGLIGTAAFAAFAVGSLNVISVAFAVLYIGLGIDFVIHYLLRVRELAARDMPLPTALEEASADVGGSLLICAITTAAGFYSFIPTSFIGVSQLGLISGTGMFISLAVTLTLLPSLLRLMFRDRLPVGPVAARWGPGLWLAGRIARRRSLLWTPLALAGAGLLMSSGLRFESDPVLLLDPGTESVRTFRELSRDPDTSPRSVSVVADSPAQAKALREQLEALPSVQQSLSLESFEAGDVEDKLAALDDLALLLGPSFSDFPELRPVDREGFEASLSALIEAAGSSDANAALGGLAAELARLRARLDTSDAATGQALLDGLQHMLLADLPRAMGLLSARLGAHSLTEPALPERFVRRWRSSAGAEVVDVIPAFDVTSPENAAIFVDEIRKVAEDATGLPVVYLESGRTVLAAFQQAFLSAFLAVTILLLIFLRSPVDTVLVLVPIGLAIAITAAAMVVIDLPLNFANVIALPLLLGIGVDNGIHLVHRSREIRDSNVSVLGTSTARAMLFSGVTTLASFGSLAVSTHLGMAAMGKLLTAGLAAILVVMLIVLPALLDFRGHFVQSRNL